MTQLGWTSEPCAGQIGQGEHSFRHPSGKGQGVNEGLPVAERPAETATAHFVLQTVRGRFMISSVHNSKHYFYPDMSI